MIIVLDYGAGNLRSVVNALRLLGYQPEVTDNAEAIAGADAVIMPGVGAAADTMGNLRAHNLVEPIKKYIAEDRPFLGICMGLQVLLTSTEEGGWHECLDVVPGKVKKLSGNMKVPHMGWNTVARQTSHPVFDGIPDNSWFYFVHSYYVQPDDDGLAIGKTEYGLSFCSALAQRNLVATQFHPEKSGQSGLKLFENFLKFAGQ